VKPDWAKSAKVGANIADLGEYQGRDDRRR